MSLLRAHDSDPDEAVVLFGGEHSVVEETIEVLTREYFYIGV